MSIDFNSRYRRLALWWSARLLEIGAKLTGRRFACHSLAGKVADGIFINSDMTVSCNCQDVDGSGRLGSLRDAALEQLLAGETALRFRRQLADGKLPVSRCPACFYLRIVGPKAAAAQVEEHRLPEGLGVENTALCNLRCLACCREEVMRTRKDGRSLSLPDVEVVGQTLARIGARYCGYYNLGEPFLSRTILPELRILRKYNPAMEILISTNGLLLNTEEKRAAALEADHVLFSIDGINTEMVCRYQRGGDFDKAYENLRALVAFRNQQGLKRPYIYWKYVVFRWNDKPAVIRRAIELAQEAGVDCLQLTFARNPLYAISWRFLFSRFFRSLGTSDQWRFRNVWFSEPVLVGAFPRPTPPSTEDCSCRTGAFAV
jgi:pyruvate-formate lyase-activating enzyme